MSKITVAAVSTGDVSLLTGQVLDALHSAKRRVLRTGCHPLASWLVQHKLPFETLDTLYVNSEDFDVFNNAAADRLLSLAVEEEDVIYAVPDLRTDTTVTTLQKKVPASVSLCFLPGISHADRCMALLGNPAERLRYSSAESFRTARVNPSEGLMLCELHSRECAGDCKLRLMNLLPDQTNIAFFSGKDDGSLELRWIPLFELDRQPEYNHLTACYIPPVARESRTRYDMEDLVQVMQRLRAPDGCPWDKEQTHESLLTSLLEESYEFIGAVRDGDIDHMYDELGDVLLQVVFHAEIARQHGDFDIDDVTTAITGKMIERHPHIFGSVKADTSAQVLDNWDALKRKQRGIRTVAQAMEDVSTGLSATMRAAKVQHKAAKVGFDFPDASSALSKVHEEASEVQECLDKNIDPEMELGDLFFSIVNVCRLCQKNPDIALSTSTNKFIDRFKRLENSVEKAGKSIEDLTLSEMDVYWEAEKQEKPPIEG